MLIHVDTVVGQASAGLVRCREMGCTEGDWLIEATGTATALDPAAALQTKEGRNTAVM